MDSHEELTEDGSSEDPIVRALTPPVVHLTAPVESEDQSSSVDQEHYCKIALATANQQIETLTEENSKLKSEVEGLTLLLSHAMKLIEEERTKSTAKSLIAGAKKFDDATSTSMVKTEGVLFGEDLKLAASKRASTVPTVVGRTEESPSAAIV